MPLRALVVGTPERGERVIRQQFTLIAWSCRAVLPDAQSFWRAWSPNSTQAGPTFRIAPNLKHFEALAQQRLQHSTSVHKAAHIPMLALYASLPSCKLLKNGRADIIDVLGSASRRFLGIAAFKGANHGQVFMADRPQAPVEPF